MKLFFTILCLFNNFYKMNIILDHFPNLSDDQKNKFLELEKIYKFWNSKINVISRKDIDNIFLHHILHSLSIAKFIDLKEGTTILDLGTGKAYAFDRNEPWTHIQDIFFLEKNILSFILAANGSIARYLCNEIK